MNAVSNQVAAPDLIVSAESAGALMTLNPVSICDTAMLHDATVLLSKKGFSAAPVVDAAGRPVGVISRADILKNDSFGASPDTTSVDFFAAADPFTAAHDCLFNKLERALVDPPLVREVMTPRVLSVQTSDPMLTVISMLVACKVHRLFVTDEQGVLVGVISAYDVLRKICADNPSAAVHCDTDRARR